MDEGTTELAAALPPADGEAEVPPAQATPPVVGGAAVPPTADVPTVPVVDPSDVPDVSLQTLTAQAVPQSSVTLPPLQAAGMVLAKLLFAAIALTILVIFVVVFAGSPIGSTPAAPSANATTDQITLYKTLVDSYKTLSDAQVSRATQLFQAVVGTALLPTFTAIVGYIFGRSNEAGTANQ